MSHDIPCNVITCLILLIAAFLSACDSAGPDSESSGSPLGLQWVEAFRKGSPQPQTGEVIDIGSVGFAGDYYFFVTNSGSQPIENVRLLYEGDDSFVFSPTELASVPPGARADAFPYIRLSIHHGDEPDGIRHHDTLPPGEHILPVILEGDLKTGSSNESTEIVRYQTRIRLNALVNELRFEDVRGTIDLAENRGYALYGGFEAGGYVRYFLKEGPLLTINSGNTSLDVRFIPDPDFEDRTVRDARLAPGDTFQVASNKYGWIRIGRVGEAVMDRRLFPRSPNGYSYLLFGHEEDR